MKHGCLAAGVIAGAFVLCAVSRASAAPLDVTLAVTVNGLTGQHQVGNGEADHYSLLPLPLGELAIRSGADSVRVEGLPPVTLAYSGTGEALATRLSIVNATVRHAFPGGWFVGAGQTVYNQTTQYVNGSNEVQASRVTGLRVEAGRTFGTAANRIEAFGAVNGRMRGVQYTTLDVPFRSCSFGGPPVCTTINLRRTFADPENASQIDLTARLAHRVSTRTELLAGLRYLNYTAHYDAAPGVLADRNVGFAPSLGARVRI
ncbi:MAG TPA: hypothetical protein VHT53_06200 [Candidatus Elarobacter sp.]|jgi:hypothetical protein|nr:hypothetical protein [Candidatus Elarobacter sp.]